MHRWQFRERTQQGRLGVATLELVLTLPMLLALIVAMVWLGFSLVGQTQVTVGARHAGWVERFGEWSGQPFDFNGENPHEATESQSVNVTPMLSSEAGPESQHVVEQGNWDHRNVKFRAAPNVKLMSEMLLAAKTAGVVSDYEDLRDAFQKLQQIGDQSLTEALEEITRELTNPSKQVESQGDAAESRAELDGELEKAKIEGERRDLREELDRLKQALKNSKDDSDDEGSDDRRWLIESQIERIEIEIELTDNKLDDLS